MQPLTQPGPTVIQVSSIDEKGQPILSVICKRTFDALPDGRLVPAAETDPLVTDLEPDPENPRRLHRDSDCYATKPLTDVVVRGHAYGTGQQAFIATVQVGSARKEVLIVGNRRVTLDPTGRLIFSDPERIEKIPLRYDRSYGGIDVVAEEKNPNPLHALTKYLDPSVDVGLSSPFAYPRNFAGVGYLIEASPVAVERITLPNLEDPLDRLTPGRLVVGAPGRWPLMPIPHAFDWTDPGTFPRMTYMGIVHDHEPFDGLVGEAARGYASRDVMVTKPLEQKASDRWANGASLGLQLPHLSEREELLLGGLHPHHPVWRFRLPKARPDIRTDGRNGKLNTTTPVIHTVDIEPDEARVSIVWRGSAAALRLYGRDELPKMPLYVGWD
jgi:hypothetical protein